MRMREERNNGPLHGIQGFQDHAFFLPIICQNNSSHHVYSMSGQILIAAIFYIRFIIPFFTGLYYILILTMELRLKNSG